MTTINHVPYEMWNPILHMPADSETGEVNSGWASMANLHGILFVISVGDIAAGGTLDAQVEQATTSAGAGIKDITGKAITQLTQAGGDSDSNPICIWVAAEDLDVANDFDHVQLEVTGAVAAAEYSVIAYGVPARYVPVATTQWGEIVD